MASIGERGTDGIPGAKAVVLEDRPLELDEGTEVRIQERQYPVGGARALLLLEEETKRPVAVLTVNVQGTELGRNEILVKTWSENERIAAAALRDPRFEDTGRRVPSGHVEAQVWTYRPDAVEKEPREVRDAAWRGTLTEALEESRRRHGVDAFTTGDWQERGRLHLEDPDELINTIKGLQVARGVREGHEQRVYAVKENGAIHNTVTGRDEYVPVTEEMVAKEMLKELGRQPGAAEKSSKDVVGEGSRAGIGTRPSEKHDPDISLN